MSKKLVVGREYPWSIAAAFLCAALASASAQEPTSEQETTASPKQDTIKWLLERIEALESRVAELEAAEAQSTPKQPDAEPQQAADNAIDNDHPVAPASPLLAPEESDRNPLVKAAFQRALIDRGGLLLPPRTLEIDPALRYLNSSSERVVIDGFAILPVLVVGDIVSERVRRDFLELSATVRYGLPYDMQIDLRAPYSYQRQDVIAAGASETSASLSALGDLELALSKQLRRGGDAGLDILGSLRWKTATGGSPLRATNNRLASGTGYDSLAAFFTAVKVVDPAVLFGGASYAYHFAAASDAGRFEPGDSYGFNLGMAVALNLNTSLSFAYEQQFVRHSTLSDASIAGSDLSTGVFNVGASIGLSDARTLSISIGIGVTEDSPDVLLNFSMPFRARFDSH